MAHMETTCDTIHCEIQVSRTFALYKTWLYSRQGEMEEEEGEGEYRMCGWFNGIFLYVIMI